MSHLEGPGRGIFCCSLGGWESRMKRSDLVGVPCCTVPWLKAQGHHAESSSSSLQPRQHDGISLCMRIPAWNWSPAIRPHLPTQMGLGIKSPTCDLEEAHSDHSRDRNRMVLAKCSAWVLKRPTGVVGWGGVGVMGILCFNCWLDHCAKKKKKTNPRTLQ